MSFKAEHVKAGFRASGLHPFNKEGIKKMKLAPATVFETTSTSPDDSATPPSDNSTTQLPEPTSAPATAKEPPQASDSSKAATGTEPVEQRLCCKKCGNDMTPVRLHLAVYFTNYFQRAPTKKKCSSNKRIKPQYYGEALTSDEIVERMEREEREKEEKLAEKERSKQERKEKRERAQQAKATKKGTKKTTSKYTKIIP